jgi:hypothetical protein
VHLLGEPAALGLLRLDDAHPQVGRELWVGRVGEQARVTALEEQPGALEVLLGQLQLAQLLLVEPQLGREALDLARCIRTSSAPASAAPGLAASVAAASAPAGRRRLALR